MGYKKSSSKRKRTTKRKRSSWGIGFLSTGAETKCLDVLVNNVGVIFSTPTVASLNSMATGVELYQRVGRRIAMQYLHFKGYLVLSGNAGVPDFVRIALVYDRQPDGTNAQYSDAFLSIDSTAATSNNGMCGTNVGNWDRFKILQDWQFPIIPSAAAVFGGSVLQDQNLKFHMDKVINLRGLEARYGQAATVPNSGQLLLMCVGNNAGGAAQSQLVYSSRLLFKDV